MLIKTWYKLPIIRSIYIAIILGCSSPNFAAFCPKNFSSIEIGDTISQVEKLCGAPDFKKSYAKSGSSSQEWTFYIAIPNSRLNAQLIVFLKDDVVVNINVPSQKRNCRSIYPSNGKSTPTVTCRETAVAVRENVTRTSLCGQVIYVGNNANQIKMACGTPAFINENQQENSQNPPIEVTEYGYYGPNPATLVFEDGRLKNIKN